MTSFRRTGTPGHLPKKGFKECSLFCSCKSHSCCHILLICFLMKHVTSDKGAALLRGTSADLAAESVNSLPLIPVWLGIQKNSMSKPLFLKPLPVLGSGRIGLVILNLCKDEK
ncbi:hypothetical protein AVEN_70201-1 [Araneus ventricosus]|uniref:Uncharacterized protein n=1 Tax=Araneus ventricosus TaxID=182803 RepID=A0A4Y2FEV7_ARAVE|nr:hypothetical protein AVEN_70201-1 [Araneus ventricosus]